MEADLRNLIVGTAAITALVPSSAIRWNLIPQGTTGPAVVLWRIDGVPGYHMKGPDGLVESRVQIDVRASDPINPNAAGQGYTQAFAIAAQIKDLLSGYVGTVGATRFQKISVLSERQTSEKPETTLYHRFSIDFSVWHCPAA